MRITIITAGSRGDVQPYVALAGGLQAAGHEVRVATYAPFEDLVRSRGLDFFLFRGDLGGATAGAPRQKWERSGGKPWAFARSLTLMIESARGLLRQSLDDAWQACQGADAIVGSPFAVGAPKIAQLLGVPFYWALLYPMTPTHAFPHFLAPPRLRLGAFYNEASYWVANRIFWRLVREVIQEWRRESFGLAPVGRREHGLPGDSSQPVLYGFSPAVVAPPAHWSHNIHVTGFWFLPAAPEWKPEPELSGFLDAGAPPLWVSLAGHGGPAAAQLAPRVVAALERTGLRGLLFAPWAELDGLRLPPTVRRVGFIPHDYLFRRVLAAYHHYGLGTTFAAVRAGIPSLGHAGAFDQPFWAWRLARLGAGLPPLPRRPSEARFAHAFARAAGDPALRSTAAALGERVRGEDGVAAAVAAFHAHLPGASLPSTAGAAAASRS